MEPVEEFGYIYFVTFDDRPEVVKICLTEKTPDEVVRPYFGEAARVQSYRQERRDCLFEVKKVIREKLKARYESVQGYDYFLINDLSIVDLALLPITIRPENLSLQTFLFAVSFIKDLVCAGSLFIISRYSVVDKIEILEQSSAVEESMILTKMMIRWIKTSERPLQLLKST